MKERFRKDFEELSDGFDNFLIAKARVIKDSIKVGDISFSQAAYLREIGQLGSPTLTELAEKMNISKPSVTRAAAKLEAKGLVARVPSGIDKRVYHLKLVENGKLFNELRFKVRNCVYEKFISSLSEEEIEQMISMMRKVLKD